MEKFFQTIFWEKMMEKMFSEEFFEENENKNFWGAIFWEKKKSRVTFWKDEKKHFFMSKYFVRKLGIKIFPEQFFERKLE